MFLYVPCSAFERGSKEKIEEREIPSWSTPATSMARFPFQTLACLQELAIDAIKIDRMFIQAIGTESLAQGILPQIMRIAEHLKLDVVLEGVETRQQLDYFIALGKPLAAQGWYFAKAGPADAVKSALLDSDNRLEWNRESRPCSNPAEMR